MESYLQSLPQDLHNVINNYVKDQIDLTIEKTDKSTNLVVKSGRLTNKISISKSPYNYVEERKKFMEFINLTDPGDASADLDIGFSESLIEGSHLEFTRINDKSIFTFISIFEHLDMEIEIPGTHKDQIIEYLILLDERVAKFGGFMGPTGYSGPSRW